MRDAGHGIGILLLDKPWGNRIGGAAFALLGVGFAYVVGLRPTLELDLARDAGRVVSPLGTTHFVLSDVVEASGGVMLRLQLASGSVLSVFAVTNANPTLVMHRRGRTEEVADQINALLRAVRDQG